MQTVKKNCSKINLEILIFENLVRITFRLYNKGNKTLAELSVSYLLLLIFILANNNINKNNVLYLEKVSHFSSLKFLYSCSGILLFISVVLLSFFHFSKTGKEREKILSKLNFCFLSYKKTLTTWTCVKTLRIRPL